MVTYDFEPVPEPAGVAMLVALIGVAVVLRKRS